LCKSYGWCGSKVYMWYKQSIAHCLELDFPFRWHIRICWAKTMVIMLGNCYFLYHFSHVWYALPFCILSNYYWKKIETCNLCFRSCYLYNGCKFYALSFLVTNQIWQQRYIILIGICVHMFLVGVWMFNTRVNVVLAMDFLIYCFKALCFISWS
jgi:hypothetical protein